MLFKGTERYPRGEFDKAVSRAGGMFNGLTSQDWTTYFETFPADRIELALQVESDRMVSEAYTESDPTATADSTPALTRADLLQALGYLVEEAHVHAHPRGNGGLFAISCGDTETFVGTTQVALEQDPTVTPLSPLNGISERISRTLSRIPDRLPLVVGTSSDGAFRAASLLSLIHISEPRDRTRSRMPSSA